MVIRRNTSGRSASGKSKAARVEKRATTGSQPEPPQPVRRRTVRSPLQRAEALAKKAWVATDVERRFRLAQQALELSADCADAYTVLGRLVGDQREALTLFKQGLEAAERSLGPGALTQAAGRFWAEPKTRPYMRARLELAECLWALGASAEAVGHLQEMLRLNPADHQGIRYVLAAHLLELGQDAAFDRLIEQYREPTTFLTFSRALREFRRSGDAPASRKLLARARGANRHVVPTLLNGAPAPEALPATFEPGDVEEGLLYVTDFAGGWRSTPGAVTWLRQTANGAARPSRKASVGPTGAVKAQLERLPQSYGTIWQAAVTRVPTWLREGEKMVRPWSILIVDHSEHLIVRQELVTEEPTATMLFDQLAQAMLSPLAGKRHRPSEIQVRDEPLWSHVQPHLEEIGVDCIFRTELEEADFIAGEMQKLMRPEGQPAGITEAATFASAQGASLYAAAASFFRRTPWRKLPSSAIIHVECPQLREFGPGEWFAVVMGQAGQALGLAIYDSRQAVEAICGGCCSEGGDTDATALSLLFGESFEVPIADLLAAEQHRWPLASPEAYPLVLCSVGGNSVRPLESWELQLLEACVRSVPDFVEQYPYLNGPATATCGPIAPANLKLTLSWVESEGFGEDCDHCEH